MSDGVIYNGIENGRNNFYNIIFYGKHLKTSLKMFETARMMFADTLVKNSGV